MSAYAVFVPATCEGIVNGWNIVHVRATSPQEAIEKACVDWYGSGATEGTYLICDSDALTAFEVGEKRVPHILSQVSVPREVDV